ncbi:hypothetical protein BX661DRAFT_172152 [Kickxella alabastrina]|uniref:uncharacterized protein n=1 Tax=Kickxella alabastrina TaxID=61397 RepID=UPI0022211205|nr:uncharacterized protein BX661DRAFT_172152 [Kickxella alabastrina]KAI7824953.1 hypothetical protein BX661DRAFT_172152 [Kickxella alabastrina]
MIYAAANTTTSATMSRAATASPAAALLLVAPASRAATASPAAALPQLVAAARVRLVTTLRELLSTRTVASRTFGATHAATATPADNGVNAALGQLSPKCPLYCYATFYNLIGKHPNLIITQSAEF